MSVLKVLSAAPAILSAQKSFRSNAAIGSTALNAKGLHRRRVALAAAMAARRRKALQSRIHPAEREAFDRDGIVVRENALPRDLFRELQRELASTPLPAWELRQGSAIDRTFPVPARPDGTAFGELSAFIRRNDVKDLIAYVAGRAGHTIAMLQTVAVTPEDGAADPQANFHADTFHSNAKFWLFLHDVPEQDGPFTYVPGSHILTPERLNWEDDQAKHWSSRGDEHHQAGSFRVHSDELSALGYGAPRTFPVKANTLVVADTFGFHRRTPSTRPTTRTALYGMSRRDPFMPWNGLDFYDMPPLRGRAFRIHLAMEDRRAAQGKGVTYHNVGPQIAMLSAPSAG